MVVLSAGRTNKVIPIILLIVLVIVSLPFSPLFQKFGYDREIYRYIGMAVSKGYLPYKDTFDHKPPVFYFISAVAYLIGPWGYWIVSFILTYITGLVILKFTRKHFTSTSFIVVVPLLYLFLSRYELIYEGGGLTREFTQIFATLIIFLRPDNQRIRFFVTGLLYSLIFLTQQNEILAITVIMAYFILWNPEDMKFKQVGRIFHDGLFFLAGCIVLCGIIGIYLLVNGIFGSFIEQAFLFNMNFYSKLSFIKAINEGWVLFYEVFPNFVLFAVLFFIFARKDKSFVEPAVIFLALFIQLYASSIGYHFRHYYLSFIPYFCYTIFIALKQLENKVAENYHRVLATAAFFLLILPLSLLFRYKAIAGHHYTSYYTQRSQYYDKVKDIKGQDGQLFVFNNPPCLALNSDLSSFARCKLMYFHFYDNPKFDKDNKLFYEMVETLKKNHCKYILDFSTDLPIEREELQQYWQRFVDTNYHVVYEEEGNYRLLQVN